MEQKIRQDVSTLTAHPLFQTEESSCTATTNTVNTEMEDFNARLMRIALVDPIRYYFVDSPELQRKRRKIKKEAKLAREKSLEKSCLFSMVGGE